MTQPLRRGGSPLRVLVTREAEKAAETARAIQARGWLAVVFPTIETVPPADPTALQDAIRDITAMDWVVFPSRTAVTAVARVCGDADLVLGRPGRPRFAAVGEGTAAALAALGIRDVLVPEAGRRDAEGLAEALIRIGVSGARVLVPRAEQGREVLAAALREAGAHVTEVVAYRTLPRKVPEAEVRSLLAGPSPDAALFMSPSAFRAFLDILGEDQARDFLSHAVLCAIGKTTARAMHDAGFPPRAVPSKPSIEAALDAIAPLLSPG